MTNIDRKPSKLGGFFRLFFGFPLAIMGLALFLEESHKGVGNALVFALFLVLGARWLLVGAAAFVGKSFSRKATYGPALALAAAMALAGPALSRSYLKGQEAKLWTEVTSSNSYNEWKDTYLKKIPEELRRAEYRSRFAEAACKQVRMTSDYKLLREQAQLAFQDEREKYDDKARQTISETYKALFAEGLKKLPDPKRADPKLHTAFRQMLQSLSSDPTRRVVLRYEARGVLGPQPSDRQYLASLGANPLAKKPVEAPGDAYTEKAHDRREANVLSVFNKAFGGAFHSYLFNLQRDDGKPQKGDITLTVTSDLHRKEGFYTNSVDEQVVSLLYKFDIDWNFAIVDGGKPLGRFHVRSEPAKSVRFRTTEGDPGWAPYSIMLDSAADNFGRQVIAGLGFTPPPEQTNYNFQK
jgi:hypothetical protein